MFDIEHSAAALYDGGWRASDINELMSEFDLNGDELIRICHKLDEFESAEKEKNQKKIILERLVDNIWCYWGTYKLSEIDKLVKAAFRLGKSSENIRVIITKG